MEQAEIIFVPYNYLIDPAVRNRMNIPIKGNIIILDEAHNIEDSGRAAASGTFWHEDFRLAFIDCEKVKDYSKNIVFLAKT
jgi:Fanconi anemia group J protein